jgi:hypothetical protein
MRLILGTEKHEVRRDGTCELGASRWRFVMRWTTRLAIGCVRSAGFRKDMKECRIVKACSGCDETILGRKMSAWQGVRGYYS